MGGVSQEGSGDKLNVELNLVPFIDLFSALVLFLLITAVWVQISAIPTNIDAKGTPVIKSDPGQMLTVHLTKQGFEIQWPDQLPQKVSLPMKIALTPEGFDHDRLTEAVTLAVASTTLPLAAVSGDDDVEYGAVVRTIDTLKATGVETVGLSSN